MRKRNFIIVFAVVFILAGCQELIGSFSASVNGTAWEAKIQGAVKSGSQYVITANKDNSTIIITIPGTNVGTYNINPLDSTIDAVVYTPDINSPGTSYIGSQGSVDLTKVSAGRLTGTFNVYAKNTANASDSIPLTGQFSNILSD
jgi:hypothetical protein